MYYTASIWSKSSLGGVTGPASGSKTANWRMASRSGRLNRSREKSGVPGEAARAHSVNRHKQVQQKAS